MRLILLTFFISGSFLYGTAQTSKSKSSKHFFANLRIDVGPFYQRDMEINNLDNIRFQAYGFHGRARYSFDEVVHVSFGGHVYKYQYLEENMPVEITGYFTFMLNPLHSIFRRKTNAFETIEFLVGIGYEGDSFLQGKRGRDGVTTNFSVTYLLKNHLTFEMAYKDRLWQHEKKSDAQIGDLTKLVTFSIYFNFMNWNKNLRARRKKVKASFRGRGI